MTHNLELAYVGLEVPDPAALDSFFTDVVGLVPGSPSTDGSMTWRNDTKAHRVFARSGAANDVVFLGLEAVDSAAFDRVRDGLEAFGCQLKEPASSETTARRVARVLETDTPWGVRLELVEKLEDESSAFASPLVTGGFLTDQVGFGHAVFTTTAFEESHEFLTSGLGFGQSDWLETEIADGIELQVRFYHCNERHHSIALAKAPFELPQTLHHLMFETRDRDDTGRAFDRAWSSGLPIANGLGRHDNDEMFSFYVTSPAGFLVEVGHGARVITPHWDDNRRYDRISAWGHQPLRAS